MNYTKKDYWVECITQAADECGAVLTPEQIALIAQHVEGGYQEIGQVFYVPESPYPAEIKKLEQELKKERAKVGCPECSGKGRLQYSSGPWAVNTECDRCHGEGKVIL